MLSFSSKPIKKFPVSKFSITQENYLLLLKHTLASGVTTLWELPHTQHTAQFAKHVSANLSVEEIRLKQEKAESNHNW